MLYQLIVSFVFGLIYQHFFEASYSVSFFILFLSLTLSLYFWRQKDFDIAKIIFVVGVGFLFGVLRIDFNKNVADQNVLNLVGQKISFESQILEEPDKRDSSVRYTVAPNFSLEYVSECTDIFLLENFSCSAQSASQGIQKHIPSISLVLLVADRFPEFNYGDKLKVSGTLELPKNFEADNGLEFDYVSYLKKDGIYFVMYRPEITKVGEGGNILIKSLFKIKNIFIQKISDVVPEPNSSLLAGVIFGNKQSLGTDLLDDFKKVGLIHIVVLSGYNITIIAIGIFYLTSLLGKRNAGFILSIFLILLFDLMVGFSATVLRATIMALISILALFLGRPADALRWLFVAGFLMLLWNPLFIFYDPSFQLSFLATLGLILFSEIIDKKIISKMIKFLIKIGVPVSFIVGAEKLKMREIISSTLAVQIFVLPLLIRMSGFVSLISFLINPIVLPLVPYTMGFGALTGAFGTIPIIGKILSWPFGIISYLLTQIIISITEFSASLSFATFQVDTLSIWLILIWYLGYGVLYFKIRKDSTLS